jgi:23S rRNA G2069 N7-methylase RlmK/C1962 C5-methylase RlmI
VVIDVAAKKVDAMTTMLGTLRKNLTEQGFTADQAFWLVQDLIRTNQVPDVPAE